MLQWNIGFKILNSDFSVDNALNVAKSLEDALCNRREGSMSQNFDLGPGLCFMLCRKFVKGFVHYFLRFSS